ncbi:alkaline phosphatase family protein [bacterium]|nr:alkaline phosphatase family protein [candidate division CSSED10-310 bacterium]
MISDGSRYRRVLILGLDCAEPQLVFNAFSEHLSTISSIAENGSAGILRSTDPPLTIPAWVSMVTGLDPGSLGCYGIRLRKDYSYSPLSLAFSNTVTAKRIWNIIADYGMHSILIGIPQTYPVSPVKGVCVAGMLTPNTNCVYTYPENLKYEIEQIVNGYVIDVPDFRTVPPGKLLDIIIDMTRKRFRLLRHLLSTRPWEFAMLVEIGLDRLHHCFWHYWDEAHPLYTENSPFKFAMLDYYKLLDHEIARVLEIIPEDTAIFIVSDHGAQAMQGGVRINEWLQQKGYLVLKSNVKKRQSLNLSMVDWSKTRVWGEGGYYCRLFFNVKGREPQGMISKDEYDRFRYEVASEIFNMKGIDGLNLENRVLFPEKIYSHTNGIPPDLMVYFGDLKWRSLAEIGTLSIFTRDNDIGPDGANHAVEGIFISNVPTVNPGGLVNLSIVDIMPSVLRILGVDLPGNIDGHVIKNLRF